ncbi:protein LKAAEAR1-like [Watersipora subatra]|uniref:protein LKAAEAR1-like n=1 Tax=Watersipora subatra TaxID=2589382 RepID=UPI00355C137B
MPDDNDGKFRAQNWKKIPEQKLHKMNSVSRSRYTAYEEPSKQVAEIQEATKKRLVEEKKARALKNAPPTMEELVEKRQHAQLIGQLKAAEARNRIRIMRLRYHANRGQEINHLISCQPSALKAVRLQALVPAKSDLTEHGDTLEKLSRDRVEALLNDNTNLMTQRIS